MESWLANLNRPVDIYCERTSPAWNAEPLNAISNLAFFLAAFAALRLLDRYPKHPFGSTIRILCIIVAVIGAGSITFHTVATRWAAWADVIPILVFMILYCWLVLTAFFQWPRWLKAAATFLLFASTLSVEAAFEDLLWGGAMYLPTLVFLMATGAGIWTRNAAAGKAFYGAAGVFILSFVARSLDMPLCDAFPLGLHYFWHILNATVLYLLLRVVIIHASGEEELDPWDEENLAA